MALLPGMVRKAAGWLTSKPCTDPNPHRPHAWPLYPDESPTHWCRGVQDVVVREGLL